MSKICALRTGLVIGKGEHVVLFRESDENAKCTSVKISDVETSTMVEKVNQDKSRLKPVCDNRNIILCMCVCKCGLHLATTDSQKRLVVYDSTDGLKAICCRLMIRKAMTLAFVDACKRIVVANKAGDVYVFDTISPSNNSMGTLLFGHLSIILSVVVTPADKYIITSDRDEKIRIMNYPNTYNINSMCLGHSEYIIDIGILAQDDRFLYSASGDGLIKFWTYADGMCYHTICCKDYLPNDVLSLYYGLEECDQNIERKRPSTSSKLLPIKKVVKSTTDFLAVLFYSLKVISIFKVEVNSEHKVCSSHLQNLTFTVEPSDACFYANDALYVICNTEETAASAYVFKDNMFEHQASMSELSLVDSINTWWPSFGDSFESPSIIPSLYKQWFDNMKVYTEAKEGRSCKRQKQN